MEQVPPDQPMAQVRVQEQEPTERTELAQPELQRPPKPVRVLLEAQVLRPVLQLALRRAQPPAQPPAEEAQAPVVVPIRRE